MQSQVKFFIRHPNRKAGNSIEELFHKLQNRVENSSLIELPNFSNSVINVLKNIFFTAKNQGKINHITGDCHYIALGLNRQNLNIITIHDCVILTRTSKWKLKYWVFKWLWFKLPIMFADVITVISEKSKKELIDYTNCNPSKIRVIPNFVNPNFKYKAKKFESKCPTILQVGTTINKNVENLIEAIKDIDCKLVIVGQLNNYLKERLIQLNINYKNYYGISQEELINLYGSSDLVAFVSKYEGFGMPIIEAQAIGRALITSNVSPMAEIAGSNACLVNPNQVESIREGILKLINDSDYREVVINSGIENINKFKFTEILNHYTQLYNYK
jgi:glycosyltransferase involved in cell wall biosynthesis